MTASCGMLPWDYGTCVRACVSVYSSPESQHQAFIMTVIMSNIAAVHITLWLLQSTAREASDRLFGSAGPNLFCLWLLLLYLPFL